MIKFIHAADFHLDAPFAALPPEKAARRRREQRLTIHELVDVCNRHACDLMLLSGDLLDSAHIYRDTLDCLRSAFSRCRAEIFIAPGNHDPYVPNGAYDAAELPKNVHIFHQPAITSIVLPELDCEVYGAAFTAADSPALLDGFHAHSACSTKLMVLHGDALQKTSPYNPVTPTQIASSGLTYLALGHIHTASGLQMAGNTAYAWPGCLMGRGFDETGEKGIYLGTIDNGDVSLQFIPLSSRKYEICRVPVDDDAAQAVELALGCNAQRHCYRVILTGQSDPIDTDALQQQFASACYSLEIIDQTTPLRDRWTDCGSDDLRGLFLQNLKALYDNASEEERGCIAQAADLGLALMDGSEVTLP